MSELQKLVEKVVDQVKEHATMTYAEFKKFLTKADHKGLGQLVMALALEIHNNECPDLEYWEINAIKSYDYVYRSEGKFATAKIAHNVRILLLSQYHLTMTAQLREHISNCVNR
jgi:hypothetical protein